jgi:uncharacterized protein YdhG (YjbR/CyaY superfamily)
MNGFQGFLDNIGDLNKKERMEGILNYIKRTFPHLKEEIRWNVCSYGSKSMKIP